MPRPPQHDDEPASALGWQLALLRALAGHARALAGRIEDGLEAFTPDALNEGTGAMLSATELSQVVEGSLELRDLADVVGVIADGFPERDELLVLSTAEIAEEAARVLSAGTAHRRGVVLSAQLLTPSTGFGALADAIMSDTTFVSRWGSLTVDELLTAFRDCEPLLIRRVCRAAGIRPEDEWATLGFDALMRVADALRSAA